MLDGPTIILILKVLVSAVTALFASSLVALAFGQKRVHGQINRLFFILTIGTVLIFELLLRLGTDVTSQFSDEARSALRTHLYFSIPSALILPVMLVSGLKKRKTLHIATGLVFLCGWIGTFVTGIFFLPHR